MIPSVWIVEWTDPATGTRHLKRYPQRAAARGAAMMLRAQGMADVSCNPFWE